MDKEKTYEPMNVFVPADVSAGTIFAFLYPILADLSSGEHVKVFFTVLFKAPKL